MKSLHKEKMRLTTLQKQLLGWLKMQGGGVLPVDVLFNTMIRHHNQPKLDEELLGERLSEAVEQLVRSGWVEVRDEEKNTETLSLYDYGMLTMNMKRGPEGWKWKNKITPSVALLDMSATW